MNFLIYITIEDDAIKNNNKIDIFSKLSIKPFRVIKNKLSNISFVPLKIKI